MILVNSRSGEAPEKAQAIAQASLAGGGEAASGPRDLAAAAVGADRARRRQRGHAQADRAAAGDAAAAPDPGAARARAAAADRPAARPGHARRARRRKSGAASWSQLLAEIEKRINEENARPKKRYISPATREEVYALYYDQLRRKIEDRGTRNFPENQGKKLYGELTMNVTVDAEGRVVDTEIVRASASKVLDRRAIAIVERGRAVRPLQPGDAQEGRPAGDHLALSLHARGEPRNHAEQRDAVTGPLRRHRQSGGAQPVAVHPRGVRAPDRRGPRATTGCAARSTASQAALRAFAADGGARLQRHHAVQVRGVRAGRRRTRTRARSPEPATRCASTPAAGSATTPTAPACVRDIERNAGVAAGGPARPADRRGRRRRRRARPAARRRPAELVVANRTPQRADDLVARYQRARRTGDEPARDAPLEDCGRGLRRRRQRHGAAACSAPPFPVGDDVLRPGALALDMMYGPAARPSSPGPATTAPPPATGSACWSSRPPRPSSSCAARAGDGAGAGGAARSGWPASAP